jgi:hypothetical protein
MLIHISSFTDSVFLAPTVASLRPRVEIDFTALDSHPSKLPHRDVLAWLGDVWFGKQRLGSEILTKLATIFWTIFTSVSVQLFYWSVWSLSFTGSEFAIMVNVTPYVFSKPGYRAYSTSREGLFTHRVLLYVLGLACYKLPSPGVRYICVVIAMWCGWAAFMGDTMRLRGSPEMTAQAKSEFFPWTQS